MEQSSYSLPLNSHTILSWIVPFIEHNHWYNAVTKRKQFNSLFMSIILLYIKVSYYIEIRVGLFQPDDNEECDGIFNNTADCY